MRHDWLEFVHMGSGAMYGHVGKFKEVTCADICIFKMILYMRNTLCIVTSHRTRFVAQVIHCIQWQNVIIN